MPYQIEDVEKIQTPQKLLGFLKFLKNTNDKIPSCLYFVVDVCFHLKGLSVISALYSINVLIFFPPPSL
jgi:hypothetical protein